MEVVNFVNGKTELYGILGDPIEHTKSPFIHNTLFKQFNINAIYIPIHVNEVCLENVINGLKAQNISGFNVTVPHKKSIIKYLDDISHDALLMGAVNTVKNIQGRLKGYNTDAEGFVRDFKEGLDTNFKDKRVMILGAGGTARALAVKLASEGIEHLTLVNRTEENAKNITELIKNNYGGIASYMLPDSTKLFDQMSQSHIIINTTPAGMSTYLDSTPFNIDYVFDKNQVVYDVVYSPEKTKFLLQAESYGCKTRNGFGMLINQGVSAFEIWTGNIVPRQMAIELLNKIIKMKDFPK
ncbi:shikimate dehydrogenase [Ruminiclostridium herbifermentans]|uniref:Shikimate dehydrogenase (NADP(+)) n=1 Tax=Ruminiclostridium herbifermentans TaxID=2488810 RepID=A0A4U7JK12_9FIRM|nr:shikimate dehydrogenase [Ruminiclostridium herbifermentans]QNU65403.1 shikimate dehydrogenase [Ruminiclostridium herbifermentans]